jgi:hypothetical protein
MPKPEDFGVNWADAELKAILAGEYSQARLEDRNLTRSGAQAIVSKHEMQVLLYRDALETWKLVASQVGFTPKSG